jgi:uncharacterized protein
MNSENPGTPAAPGTPPLGPDDFDAQDAVLDALREHDDEIPQWEFCEGFLAALVCCRRAIGPDEYWPVLLGDGFKPCSTWSLCCAGASAGPRCRPRWTRRSKPWTTSAPTTRGAGHTGRHPGVARGPARSRHARPVDPAGLCPGVGAGLHVCGGELARRVAAPARCRRRPHAGRSAQCHRDPDRRRHRHARDVDVRRRWPAQREPAAGGRLWIAAIWAVYDLRQLWKSLGPRVEQIRKAPEPGRNDPCPCGSGKKYKKCHGGTPA